MSFVYWYLDFAVLFGERTKPLQCSRDGVRSLLTFQTFIMLKINSYRATNIEHLRAKKRANTKRIQIREKEKTKKMANGRLDAMIVIFVMKLCCELFAICVQRYERMILWLHVVLCCAILIWNICERAAFKLCMYLAKFSINATTTKKMQKPKRRPNTVLRSFNETIKMRWRTENGRWPFRSLHCHSLFTISPEWMRRTTKHILN